MNNTIGVLGCGWLGFPLAEKLLKKGYSVKGSTTSEAKLGSLAAAGIMPFYIEISGSGIKGDLKGILEGLDCLILNIPPGLRKGPSGTYLNKLGFLLEAFKKNAVPRLLYISSTAVYGNKQGQVTETDPPLPEDDKGCELLEAEKYLSGLGSTQTQIIRMGGLIGGDRHPSKQLAGKEIPSGGNNAINLIHRSDAILAIISVLEQPFKASLFNAVCPEHPRKRDYYASEAIKRGLEPPVYQDPPGPCTGKMIDSDIFPTSGIHFNKSLYSN